jgi:hypothetical protein
MATMTITYDQIERNAEAAFAYALLARLAKTYLTTTYRLFEVAAPLDLLVKLLTPDRVERLAADESEEAVRLRHRLEELHGVLTSFAHRADAASSMGVAVSLPLIGNLVVRIQERTEDLGDMLENIQLARNADFKNLVSCCNSSLEIQQPEGVVGRMQA